MGVPAVLAAGVSVAAATGAVCRGLGRRQGYRRGRSRRTGCLRRHGVFAGVSAAAGGQQHAQQP